MPIRNLLQTLGIGSVQSSHSGNPFAASLAAHLDDLTPQRIEYLAGFAGELTRVAYADDDISDHERAQVAHALDEHAGLSADESAVVIEILATQLEKLRGIGEHALNRAVNEHATAAEKEKLVDSLFAVAAADGLISDVEDREIRKIAHALHLPPARTMEIRSRYRDHLEVLRVARSQRDQTPSSD